MTLCSPHDYISANLHCLWDELHKRISCNIISSWHTSVFQRQRQYSYTLHLHKTQWFKEPMYIDHRTVIGYAGSPMEDKQPQFLKVWYPIFEKIFWKCRHPQRDFLLSESCLWSFLWFIMMVLQISRVCHLSSQHVFYTFVRDAIRF